MLGGKLSWNWRLHRDCIGHTMKNEMIQFKIAHDVLFREVSIINHAACIKFFCR